MQTLGLVESKSIAAGAALLDGMLKSANVSVVRSSAICSGRYLIIITGDVASVEAAVLFAEECPYALVAAYVLSGVSNELVHCLRKGITPSKGDSIGIVEARLASAILVAADVALKHANVQVMRLVLGNGINGKGYVVFSGSVADVEEAVRGAEVKIQKHLVESVVIAHPHEEALQALLGKHCVA